MIHIPFSSRVFPSQQARECPMLIELGSFTKKTKDIVQVPFIYDGKLDERGMQLYKFA
jgi:hypothetical protein